MKLENHYKIAILYTLVLFLDRIDLTILNVAIPYLVNFFDVKPESTEWFNLSFLIGLCLSMCVSSWFGEKFGYKKIFLFGVLCFGIFSGCVSQAKNFYIFIFFRLLQGFAGGIMILVGNTILFSSCEKKDYAKMTNFVFLPTLLALALAPFLGGLILEKISYKWIFYINIPICLIVSILGFFFYKRHSNF